LGQLRPREKWGVEKGDIRQFVGGPRLQSRKDKSRKGQYYHRKQTPKRGRIPTTPRVYFRGRRADMGLGGGTPQKRGHIKNAKSCIAAATGARICNLLPKRCAEIGETRNVDAWG